MINTESLRLNYLLVPRPFAIHQTQSTCFLLQKQSRHAEAIRKENSAEVLLVSSLTTAVFFSGIPYIAVTIAVKYSLSRPPLASRVCNHPPTPQMYPRSNKTLPRYLHSLTNWDVTAAAALVLQPSHQIPNLCLLSKGVSTQCL